MPLVILFWTCSAGLSFGSIVGADRGPVGCRRKKATLSLVIAGSLSLLNSAENLDRSVSGPRVASKADHLGQSGRRGCSLWVVEGKRIRARIESGKADWLVGSE